MFGPKIPKVKINMPKNTAYKELPNFAGQNNYYSETDPSTYLKEGREMAEAPSKSPSLPKLLSLMRGMKGKKV